MTIPSVNDGSPNRALVTGACGLIGSAVVDTFAERGSHVYGVDFVPRSTDVERIDRMEFFQADVANLAEMESVAQKVEPHALDCVVHAGAITGQSGTDLNGSLVDVDWGLWNEVLRVNVSGTLAVVRACVPLLRRSAPSRVVLLGSIQGLVPTLPTGVYGATKAAVGGLCRQLAAELAEDAITVNMLAPGTTTLDEQSGFDNPLGRTASVAEMAAAAVEVATGAFGFMTGATIPCDGGEHLRPRHAPARG